MGDLIERLSQATGPSRELDEAIHEVMFGPLTYTFVVETGGRGPEHYTASIDAALTLVPEGHDWLVGREDDVSTACVQYPHFTKDWVAGANPAIALCIAALKARTHDQP